MYSDVHCPALSLAGGKRPGHYPVRSGHPPLNFTIGMMSSRWHVLFFLRPSREHDVLLAQ